MSDSGVSAAGTGPFGRISPLWLGVGAAALVALIALGFAAGRALAGGALLALVSAMAGEDGEVLRLAPLDTALIVVELVPWIELAGCAVALVALGIALRRIATVEPAP